MTEYVQPKFLVNTETLLIYIVYIHFALFANYEYKSTILPLAAKAAVILRQPDEFVLVVRECTGGSMEPPWVKKQMWSVLCLNQTLQAYNQYFINSEEM